MKPMHSTRMPAYSNIACRTNIAVTNRLLNDDADGHWRFVVVVSDDVTATRLMETQIPMARSMRFRILMKPGCNRNLN